ncbi:MAG: peptidoglycan DD-metalloendopeptidase family protein [Lachnospiraceae bacterium]|nr:peptidoglycan DD-metalloendopeptidase family protein [Lachnospiraceae bacterium]
MKRVTMTLACVVLTFCMAITSNATSLSGITSDSIKQMQGQISDANDEKEELENSLKEVKNLVSQLRQEKADLNSYITELDANLEEIETQIEDLKNQITLKEAEIVETEELLAQAKEVEANQHDAMDNRIRLMYVQGEQRYLELLLTSSSFSDFLNRAVYVNAIAQYDQDRLDEYVQTREYVELCEEQLRLQKEILDATKVAVEEEQAALEELIDQKRNEIEKYEASISNKEESIEEYEAMIAEQDELIKELEEAVIAEQKKILAQQGSVVIYDGGQFKFPLASYTRISDDYGWRIHPILNTKQFHNGVDFAAPKGTAIYAAYDGEVVAATYSATMGNYVMINHGSGLYTIYMHASALYCSKGDVVVRGETIAAVGTTGRSTGNHLHFSVRKDGSYVSPWNYLKE